MSSKNETATLILTLLLTVSVVGGGMWWLSQHSGFDLSRMATKGDDRSPAPVAPPTSAVDSFAKVSPVPAGLFNYGGSTTWAPIRRDVDPAIQIVWTNFRLRYTDPTTGAPGSGSGIRMLLDNQLAFAQSSRSIEDKEYQQAQQRGFSLKEIPVAIDGIAIAVNPNLNPPGLTLEQIQGIYTGKLTNWNQVGGPNQPIVPYSRRLSDGGTVEFFHKNVLDGADFAPNVVYISTTTEALRQVATNLGGLYYASAPEVVGQCTVKSLPIGRKASEFVPPYQEPAIPLSQCRAQRNQLNASAFQSGQYPITRRLFVVVKQNGQTDQQAGEAYANLLLTDQGQELIAKAGFVRIR